jgi:pimeloyl-ACP methyl ester carboxylesterase
MSYLSTADGGRLFYQWQPGPAKPPVIIFISGFAQTAVQWHPQQRFFKQRHGVMTYDARGLGRSRPGTLPPTAAVLCDDLTQLTEITARSRFILVGMSRGALVARMFAARYASRVRKLVLVGAGLQPDRRMRRNLNQWLQLLRQDGCEAFARAALPFFLGERFRQMQADQVGAMAQAMVKRHDPQALEAHLEAILAEATGHLHLPPPSCPSLVIRGREDRLVSAKMARQLVAQCRAGLVEIAGAGHSVSIESPRRFNEVLDAFIQA